MSKPEKMTQARVREWIAANGFRGGEVTDRDIPIGRYVVHGDRNRKTVYASRIYLPGCKIEVTSYTKNGMLTKVAKAYWAYLKDFEKKDKERASSD